MTPGRRAARGHYLDASALVKLVANDADEDQGREVLREYFFNNGLHHASAFCVAEALSAFKLKWLRQRITQDEYFHDVREFFRVVVPGLTLEQVPLSAQVLQEAERLMSTHTIDFIDSIQLVTILKGPASIFVEDSQTLFITADRSLAAAARHEGAKVWECTQESVPR